MSPTKLKKTRKLRGSRTMGWGQVGQHRKHSQKGETKSGRHKHLWTYVQRYEPNYFGKKGFKTPKIMRGESHPNTINLSQLDQLIEKQTRHKQITKKHGKPYIDLTAQGYSKLLAKGKLTQPALIKINSYSKSAAKKIQEAGGQIIDTTKEPETTKPEIEEPTVTEETEKNPSKD